MIVRRGTAAQWAARNPILLAGEVGFAINTAVLKIGDGVSAWSALPSYALLPVNPTGQYLKDDGTTGSGGEGGSANVKQTEVDFGAMPVPEATFIVADVDVTPSSNIIGSVAFEAPTGKDLDELEMDSLDLKFAPGSGQLTINARGLDGLVADKFKIKYLVA